MGIEYRLRFEADYGTLDTAIRNLRCFHEFDESNRLYALRSTLTDTEGMPSAWVAIEVGGLYFVDNGGDPADSAMVFRSVVDLALDESSRVEVELL